MGERIYGSLFDISAKGMISKRKKRFIEFHLRGPDKKGNPVVDLKKEDFIIITKTIAIDQDGKEETLQEDWYHDDCYQSQP